MIRHHNAKTLFHQLLSVLLSLSMFSSVLAGSITVLATGIKTASASGKDQKSMEPALRSAALLTSAKQRDQKVDFEESETDIGSHQWDSIIGNFEMFVYGLLITEFQNLYEVFNGEITLPDGTEVYGIGFTDFDTYFEADNGSGFFPAGFIPLIGEADIPEDAKESGVEIRNVELIDTGVSFVLAYDTEPFLQHCVIWNHYLQYGIDEDGHITYTAQEYVRGHCNEELGALYSYDERRFVFDPNVGNYKYIAGQSLYTPVDYAALEAEVNRILSEQDINFSMVEVRTAVYTAQEAFTNYLLSLQEESFMGYPVSEIIQIAEQLDPMELIRFTPAGHIIINIADEIPDSADALTKWLTGIGCGMLIAASIALKPIAPLSGAISAIAIDIFFQVVLQNQSIPDVNWKKVAVSALTGATMAWIPPLLASGVTKDVILSIGQTANRELVGKAAGYMVQTMSNSFISGITGSVMAIIDEKSDKEIWDAFLVGAVIGSACTVLSSVIAETGNVLMVNKITPWIQTHPNNWFVNAAENVKNFIEKFRIPHIEIKNQKLADILRPKSVYQSAKYAMDVQDDYLHKVYKYLPSEERAKYFDLDGNPISKKQLKTNGVNCIIKLGDKNTDPVLQEKFIKFHTDEIRVINGKVDFSNFSVCDIDLGKGITSDRAVNYNTFAEILAKNPSLLPSELTFTEAELANLDSGMILDAISNAGLTPHEGADGVVYLVDSYVHSKITHAGGVALAESIESIRVSTDYLQWLTNNSISTTSPIVLSEGVF